MSTITFSHSLSLSDLALRRQQRRKSRYQEVRKSVDLRAYDSDSAIGTRISELCLTIRKKMRFHGDGESLSGCFGA